MNSIFTFFLLVTILLISIIAAKQVQQKNTPALQFLKFNSIPIAKATTCIKSIWLPTGSNYLIDTYKPPGETVWLPQFSSKQKTIKTIEL
jgi:hypothetical protein